VTGDRRTPGVYVAGRPGPWSPVPGSGVPEALAAGQSGTSSMLTPSFAGQAMYRATARPSGS
jgi:hypothetical protein